MLAKRMRILRDAKLSKLRRSNYVQFVKVLTRNTFAFVTGRSRTAEFRFVIFGSCF